MRFVTLLLAASLACPLLAQAPSLQQGVALFNQGRWEDARRTLTPLAAREPEAQYWLGRIALEENRSDEAVSVLEKAAAALPNRAEVHLWLGDAYGAQALRAGMIKQATIAPKVRREYERAVQLDANNIDARDRLIQFYLLAPGVMGGSVDKAKAQALEIGKRDKLRGHRALATIAMNQKDPATARRELQTAVKEQPGSAPAHTALGSFYMTVDKNYKATDEELQAALRIDPAYMPVYARIGQLAQLSRTNLPRGEEALRKYLTYVPKDREPSRVSALFWLGGIYEAEGRKAEARQAYLQAQKIAPDVKMIADALKRVS
jgi:tetratricopeptide (TPR) repeat protein